MFEWIYAVQISIMTRTNKNPMRSADVLGFFISLSYFLRK
jgi:hypothetical protein